MIANARSLEQLISESTTMLIVPLLPTLMLTKGPTLLV